MRKVTKGLLVAGFAALVMSACQDSVSIVQPAPVPPPPPPPPPPPVDATVTIQALRTIPGNLAVNPTSVMGDINVVLNVEEGDNTITQVDLLYDGVAFGCEEISTASVPGEGVSLSSGGAADVLECFWNTDGVAGECLGAQLDAAFNNGTGVLGARITLTDGTTRDANNTQTVTLVNTDHIVLGAVLAGSPVIGTNGRAFVGGPDDLVEVAACPVSYNGITVGELGIGGYTTGGTANGGADADLGSNPGIVHQDDATPFLFALDPTLNGGGGVLGEVGGVEDDPIAGLGHNFGNDGTTGCVGGTAVCFGPVFGDNGLNVTSGFTYGSLTGIYADYVGPVIAAGAMIEIDGVTAMTGVHYSGGDYGLSAAVSDLGVGLLQGGFTVYNTNDCDGGAATCGSGTNTVVVADGVGIGDLAEDDELDDGDTNGLDTYEVEVTKVADDLNNNSTTIGMIVNNPSGPMGVDVTEPGLSNDLPATDPADDPMFVLNDLTVMLDAADPLLASGDPGSGVDNSGCTAAADGTTCTNITAVAGTVGYETFEAPAGSFSADIADVGATVGAALPDGETTLTVSVPDVAVLTANTATWDFTFIYDTMGPDIKPFTSFESNATLSGGAAQFNLAGQIVDGDGVVNSGEGSTIATLSLGIYVDSVNFDCGTTAIGDITPLAQGSAAGEVDNQNRSIADTDGGELDFTQNTTEDYGFSSTFLVQNPGAGMTVTYCMIVDGTDSALDKTGAANANIGRAYNQFVITWQ